MPKQPRDVERPDVEEIAKRNIAEGKKVPTFILCCGESDAIAYTSHMNARKVLPEWGYQTINFSLPGYNHEWDFWEICFRHVFAEWLPTKQKTKTEGTAAAWAPRDPSKDE